MALSQATLAQAIGSLPLVTDAATASQAWSHAYLPYAYAAQDAGNNALAAIPSQSSLATTLATECFANTHNTPAQAASAFAKAFALFWTGASFAPGAPAPGQSIGGNGVMAASLKSQVTSVMAAALQQQLIALFMRPSADTPARADALAMALHTATTTAVFVLMSGIDTTPSPAGPLPCTQLVHMH